MKRALAHVGLLGLALFAFIFAMGAVKLFKHPEPGGSALDWIIPGVLAVPCTVGTAVFSWQLLQPVNVGTLLRPAVQAVLIYAAALPAMYLAGSLSFAVALLAFSVFAVTASVGALLRPRWLTTAGAAVFWSLLLFVVLNETAENARGYPSREGMRLDMLPMGALPALLAVAGAVRFVLAAIFLDGAFHE